MPAAELRKAAARKLAAAAETFSEAARNTALRRLTAALVPSVAAEGVYAVGIAVYAFEQGGAAAVGLVTLGRMILAAVASPFAAVLGDRFRRERVMLVTDAARGLALAGMGLAVGLRAPPPAVYALAGLLAVVWTAFWPAQAALLPSLARDSRELTAGNVVTSTIEGIGSFVGPAAAGAILLGGGAAAVFSAAAAGFLWSAFAIARIPVAAARRPPAQYERVIAQLVEGFRVIGRDARARLLVALFAAQMLVFGALNVLVVVAALELLGAGLDGVGYLSAAVGLGGILGVVGAASLVGSRRLGSAFGLGLVLWGLPIALIGLWPSRSAALGFLLLAGAGYTVGDVAGFTLLQRIVDDSVLARLFGSLESIALVATGLGAVLAPVVIHLLGVRGALAAVGAFLPLVTLLTWRRLRDIDVAVGAGDRGELLWLLRRVPIFALLPLPTLERLAARAALETHRAGATIVRQGDAGDRFYVVARGTVEIDVDGLRVGAFGPGAFFGEIGLIRGIPRTATVVAQTEVQLAAVDGAAFVTAVSGHADSARAAEHFIVARLGFRAPGGALS